MVGHHLEKQKTALWGKPRIEIFHILVDDPNIALNKRETKETKQFFSARHPPPHSIAKGKVSYVYLRVMQNIVLTPMFFDKFAILYEPMEECEVQDLTWHGLPIPKLAPNVTTYL